MRGFRELLRGRRGLAVAVGLIVLAAAALTPTIRRWRADGEAARASRDRVFICAQTGKTFQFLIEPGCTYPVLSPHSHKNTGYPAEMCYWTAEGNPKAEPTPVLLNQYAGIDGPTFCPDCGRLVRGHNPPPRPGAAPPPTRAEIEDARAERD